MNGKTKLFCYLIISLLTALATQLETFDSSETPAWSWVGWTRFGVFVTIPVFTTLRAYLDQTMSREAAAK